MTDQVPSLAFADLLAYTDFLAQRWLSYFERNPTALEVDIGGRAGSLHGLVTHIFQVENFFADLLLQEGAGATARPAQMPAHRSRNFNACTRRRTRSWRDILTRPAKKP
jgi:uncharacterized damage-inducible protein DinB